MHPSRRDVLAGLAALPLASALGCGASTVKLPPAGEIVGAAHARGHLLRMPPKFDDPKANVQKTRVAIIGGGVAGLSAARKLEQAGANDFVVLELEDVAGGTSRSGQTGPFAHPWGAHYLPAPLKENAALVALLEELGAVEGYDADGEPRYAEEMLCRDPEERLFAAGTWTEGLWPTQASADDNRQLQAFQREVETWVRWRDDDDGRRAFTLPIASCSTAAEARGLDRSSFADWLDTRKLTSPVLRWWLEYATRDDYGLTLAQTSAWAGLFYYSARAKATATESQPLLTWPEGNGRLVRHLHEAVKSHVRTGVTVIRISAGEDHGASIAINAIDAAGAPLRYIVEQAIYAAPQFTASFVIQDFPVDRRADAKSFQYGAWLVANLSLKNRPANAGFEPSWDNVLYDSAGLGYVSATHQAGRDHGPTVWTYYYPFTDDDPAAARERLLAMDWPACAELVLSDLERAHPDVRGLVERLDVMRWGHAMIQPRVGFLFGGARERASEPWRNIHFAHSDLSGIALFEEAFDRGLRAAEAVLASATERSTMD